MYQKTLFVIRKLYLYQYIIQKTAYLYIIDFIYFVKFKIYFINYAKLCNKPSIPTYTYSKYYFIMRIHIYYYACLPFSDSPLPLVVRDYNFFPSLLIQRLVHAYILKSRINKYKGKKNDKREKKK